MQANVTSRSELSFKLEIEIPYSSNMLEAEEIIQQSINQDGSLSIWF